MRSIGTKPLWAPWRMAYIRKHSDRAKCFLCASHRGKADRKNLIVARGRACFVIMNRYPYTVGHLMIAPAGHKAKLAQLTAGEREEMFALAAKAQRALDRVLHPHGYNLGINLGRVAGAGLLDHLHLHVVPRWGGDTNFMPVTGGVRVMPVSLGEVYASLRRHW